MVHKRPFDGEGQHEVTSKLPRQEHCDRLALFSEFGSFGDTPKVPDGSGEAGFTVRKVEQELVGEKKTKPPLSNEEEADCTFPGCYSISSWGTSSTSEEDIWSEAPFHGSFFPEYFYPQRPVRTLPRYEEIYSLLLENPPQKPVPIGPDHQADIPALREQAFENVSNYSASIEVNPNSDGQQLKQVTRDVDEGHLGGICVIPMPNCEQFGNSDDKIGNGRIDCCCGDRGSFRCVRKHVAEARDKLKRVLGPETFAELGFFDMGEHVAEKWTDEEEKIFHEIVFSNPASIGKNFWINLSAAFPSHMKGEIVSYYFNVFMLRKRAEQNRCDPMNIDSDNDEWQANEEEDDSVVESPVHGVDPADSIHRDHVSEYDDDHSDDVADEPCDDDRNASFKRRKGMADIPGGWPGKNNYQENLTFQLEEKTWDDRVDQGAQDDSCTSSDTVAVSQGTHGKDYDVCRNVCFDRLIGDRSHDNEMELCNGKVWSSGCMACPKGDVDFLPTFSMIEEVFGHGSSSCKPDRKDLG